MPIHFHVMAHSPVRPALFEEEVAREVGDGSLAGVAWLFELLVFYRLCSLQLWLQANQIGGKSLIVRGM